MYICVYMCMCIYNVCVCVCVHVCLLCVHICVHSSMYMRVRTYVCVHACMCVHIFVFLYMSTSVCLYVVHVCACVVCVAQPSQVASSTLVMLNYIQGSTQTML